MLSLSSASLACFTPAVIVHPDRRARFAAGLSQRPVHEVAAVTKEALFSHPSSAQIFRNSSHFAKAFRDWDQAKAAYLMSTRATWTWALQNEQVTGCPWLLLLEDDAVLPPGFDRLVTAILAHHSAASVIMLDARSGSYSETRVGSCCLAAALYHISVLPVLLERLDPWHWQLRQLQGVDLAILPLLNDSAAKGVMKVANVPIVGTAGLHTNLKVKHSGDQQNSEKAWPWTLRRATWPDWLETSVRSTPFGSPPRCNVVLGTGNGTGGGRNHHADSMAGLLPMDMHLCKPPVTPLESPASATGAWRFPAPKCYPLDFGLAQAIAALLKGYIVADLGAGVGCYTEALAHLGVRHVVAVDGAEGIDEVTGGRVQRMDLALSTDLHLRADYVLSLEVGEHIPARWEHVLLRHIDKSSICGAIVSWAQPGQGGGGHVNERSSSYVQAALGASGLLLDQNVTKKLREAAGLPYLRRTAAFYVRRDAPPHCLQTPPESSRRS